MDSICRLCAGIKKIENFVTRDLYYGLNVKLEKCCQVTIQENDGLPQNICVDCAQNLEDSWKFATKVHEAQESLQRIFGTCNKNENESKTKILRNISKPIYQNKIKHPIAKTQSEDTIMAVDDNDIQGTSASNNYEDDDINTSIKIEEFQITEELEEVKLDIDHNDINNIFDDDSTNFDSEMSPMKEPNPNSSHQIGNPDDEVQLIEVLETWTDYTWSCKICSMTFGNSNDIQTHSKEVHNTDDMPKFSCIDCSKNFDEYNKYLNHIKAHHKPNLMLCCDVCSLIFANYKILADHRKIHKEHGELSLCEMCGKAFKNEKKLQIHSTCHQIVEGKCKLTCDTCGKKFSSRPNLKAHQKIHAGIKEFICDQCGKSFVQKANLAEHMLTHTTDVPYECTDCHKNCDSDSTDFDKIDPKEIAPIRKTTNQKTRQQQSNFLNKPRAVFNRSNKYGDTSLLDIKKTKSIDIRLGKLEVGTSLLNTKVDKCLQLLQNMASTLLPPSNEETIIPDVEERIATPEVQDEFQFPLNNRHSITKFEEALRDPLFKNKMIAKFTLMLGNSDRHNGRAVAYKLVDLIFSRVSLMDYSWTGMSKDSVKHNFSALKQINLLFTELVSYADGQYNAIENENFFKNSVLKHSLSRSMPKLCRRQSIPRICTKRRRRKRPGNMNSSSRTKVYEDDGDGSNTSVTQSGNFRMVSMENDFSLNSERQIDIQIIKLEEQYDIQNSISFM